MPAPKTPFVWSSLTVKSIDESERVLEGVASTPSTDRVGDIVESMGATYKLPIPFLFQHDSSQPIGHVIRAAPNASGIPVTIRLVKSTEPGTLKDRLDEAWQSIKLGLVKGLSIGFKPVETSYIEATGGYRFSKWDWLELSAVTIPANADASISTIKRCDLALARPPQKSLRSFKSLTWEKTTPEQFAHQLGNYFLETFGDLIVEGFAAHNARIKAIREELAARTYRGVHDPALKYLKHNMVTSGGSLWIAIEDDPGEPGRSPGWKMAVKKGRDARD